MKFESICMALPILGLTIEILFFAQSFDNNWRILTIGSTALVALPTLFAILLSTDDKTCLALIIISSFFIQIMYFLSFKDFTYVPPRDAAYHLQVVDSILAKHSVPLGEGVGQALAYSYYPGMHILLSQISLVTSLDPVFIVKLSPLLYIAIPLALYALTNLLTRQTVAARLAAFIFVFVPYGAYSPKYNFLALAFFLFLVLSLSMYQVRRRINLLVTSLLFALALSMTHHLTSYILLTFLTAILVLTLTHRKSILRIDWSSWNPIKWHVFALICLTITWALYVGQQILSVHGHVFLDLIGRLESSQEKSLPFLTGTYSTPELYFIVASLVSILILGVVSFIFYLRDGHSSFNLVFPVIFFGSLFLLAYLVRNVSEPMEELSLRVWSYFFIGLAPMIGYLTARIGRSYNLSSIQSSKLARRGVRLFSMLLIFLIVSCYVFSAVDLIPRQYYNFNEEKETSKATVLRGFGEKIASSIRWYNAVRPIGSKAIGDGIMKDMSAPFAFSIDSRYDFYDTPALYRTVLIGQGYIFIDYLFGVYDQTPEWKVVKKSIDLGNATQLAESETDLVMIYNNGLVSILFKRR